MSSATLVPSVEGTPFEQIQSVIMPSIETSNSINIDNANGIKTNSDNANGIKANIDNANSHININSPNANRPIINKFNGIYGIYSTYPLPITPVTFISKRKLIDLLVLIPIKCLLSCIWAAAQLMGLLMAPVFVPQPKCIIIHLAHYK